MVPRALPSALFCAIHLIVCMIVSPFSQYIEIFIGAVLTGAWAGLPVFFIA
jgi:hypothetical protein